jgi:hypothetical protein
MGQFLLRAPSGAALREYPALCPGVEGDPSHFNISRSIVRPRDINPRNEPFDNANCREIVS